MARFVQKKEIELHVESENHSRKADDMTSVVTEWKWWGLFGIGFGVLCVLQVALNVSLRLFLYNQTLQNEAICKSMTEQEELRNRTMDVLFREGWIYFRTSFYYVSTTQKTWQESREDCLHRGADLMIIDSQEEQDFSKRLFKRMWIGLTDTEKEGVWKWVDGSLLRKSFWETGEPNNEHGTENCAEINFRDGWNDFTCNHLNYWICEKKVAP